MRREFSNPDKREARERSGGICECARLHTAGVPGFTAEGCGQPLGAGNTFYEHVIPDHLGGEPSLDNCAVLTKTCWKLKTSIYDRPHVDKMDRQQDRERGIGRADKWSRRLPGGKNSPLKAKIGGGVVDRRTGARL